jgi:hypothetical protein
VQILLSDSAGKSVGFDSKSAKVMRELGECGYGLTGVGDIGVPLGRQTNEQSYELWVKGPPRVTFTLKVFGEYGGQYSLRIRQGGETATLLTLNRFIFKGTEQAFALSLSAGTKPILEKKTNPRVLREVLDNCYRMNLLGDKDLYKDLTHRLDKFEKYLAHKDSSKAREELEDFKDKIEDVRKQTVKKEQKKERREKEFLTKDAYQILLEDVDALLKQLPQRRKGKGWDHDDRDRP